MREIKFRGKKRHSKAWVRGYVFRSEEDIWWILDCERAGAMSDGVIKETIGQFTGLKDKNGVEIYEGDVLICDSYPFFNDGKPNYRAVVEWANSGWYAEVYSVSLSNAGRACGGMLNEDCDEEGAITTWEIVGNIHDNPELLERK